LANGKDATRVPVLRDMNVIRLIVDHVPGELEAIAARRLELREEIRELDEHERKLLAIYEIVSPKVVGVRCSKCGCVHFEGGACGPEDLLLLQRSVGAA
jgi:hypothetical protein